MYYLLSINLHEIFEITRGKNIEKIDINFDVNKDYYMLSYEILNALDTTEMFY